MQLENYDVQFLATKDVQKMATSNVQLDKDKLAGIGPKNCFTMFESVAFPSQINNLTMI